MTMKIKPSERRMPAGLVLTLKLGDVLSVNDDLLIQFRGREGQYIRLNFKGDKDRYHIYRKDLSQDGREAD